MVEEDGAGLLSDNFFKLSPHIVGNAFLTSLTVKMGITLR
jgi:hypothetical protein